MRQRPCIVALGLTLSMFLATAASAQHAQYYVLDGFGGVHAAGGAPVIAQRTPYFGWNIAADIAYVPLGTAAGHGDGILVLDGFGGVHSGGALASAPPTPAPPYFGFDVAKAIAYRNVPTRVAGGTFYGTVNVTNSSYLAMNTVSIHAPDDGYLLLFATITVDCATMGSAGVLMDFALTVDTTVVSGVPTWRTRFEALTCQGLIEDTTTVTRLVPVSAGSHTVFLLAKDSGGGTNARLRTRVMNVLFVDQDGSGGS